MGGDGNKLVKVMLCPGEVSLAEEAVSEDMQRLSLQR